MSFATTWNKQPSQAHRVALLSLVHGPWPPAQDYMELVKASNNRGIYASTGDLFGHAIFGRDSLETGEEVLETHPQLVRDIILTLASLQGTKTNTLSEEEPGKIPHEYRSIHLDDYSRTQPALDVLHDMQRLRGGEGTDELIYYGTFDATPLYIRLLGHYVMHYGPEILRATFQDRAGHTLKIEDSVHKAVDWLTDKIESTPEHLFTYRRLNPHGMSKKLSNVNQTWKDSPTSFLFADGRYPNFDTGIAALELQGYAYDALQMAATILDTKQRDHWRRLATDLQRNVLERFWLTEQRFFAQGLNRDEQGNWQPIDTLTSDGGVIFETNLLHDLPQHGSRAYFEDTMRHLFGPDFLTDIGIRSRSLHHTNVPGFADYHSSLTVWPKETFDIIKALRKYDHHALAAELENRMLAGIVTAGEFYEFFYVQENGKVLYDIAAMLQYIAALPEHSDSPIPEPGQAWTIAAVLNILYHRHQALPPQPTPFEQEILATISHIPIPGTTTDQAESLDPLPV